ncbi:MAG: hypothetical protein ACE5EI_04415 [Thermodesulfobacteriota bacterium]
MISRSPDRAERLIVAVLFVTLVTLIFFQAFQKQHFDSDIFWALKSGEWITANLKVPATDPFSYTFGGEPWIDFTWGFQVIAHLFHAGLGGWTGLFVLQLIVSGALFFVVFRNARLLGRRRTWLVAAVLVTLFASSYPRLIIRPHLPAYLLISLFLYLFTLYEKTGRKRCLAALPLLQVLWVNTHSSFILGIFIVGAYAAGRVVDEWRSGGFGFRLDLSGTAKGYLLAAAAMPVVSLANPYGPRLLVFPFIHQGADNADALRHIGEWQSLPLNEILFYLYPVPVDNFAFKVLLLGALAALVLNYRRVKTRDVLILAGAFYMAWSHIRWFAQFGYFAAPVLVANLAAYLDARRPREARAGAYGAEGGGGERAWKWGAILIASMIAAIVTPNFFGRSTRAHYGIGEERGAYPAAAVEFIKDRGISGNVFNEYVFGGYLIYHTYPEVRPFIDPRTPTVYSPYFFWASRLADDERVWARLEERYGIDMALLRPDTKVCGNLWKDPRWVPVIFDDKSVLYLKDVPRFGAIISDYGLRYTNPCSTGSRYEMPEKTEDLEGMRTELSRMTDGPAGGASRPWRLLGLVSTELGGRAGAQKRATLLGEAVGALESSLALKDDSTGWYYLGTAQGRLGRKGEAVASFLRAIRADGSNKDAWLGAGVAYFDMKEYDEAVRRLTRYVLLADDTSTFLGYRTLGRACLETGDLGCAEAYLKRAALIAEDPEGLAGSRYYLGNVYLAEGRFAEATAEYAEALRMDRGYGDALKKLSRDLAGQGKNEMARAVEAAISSAGGGD